MAYNTNIQNNTGYISKAKSFFKKLFIAGVGAATIAPPVLGNIDAVVNKSLNPKYNATSEYKEEGLPSISDHEAVSNYLAGKDSKIKKTKSDDDEKIVKSIYVTNTDISKTKPSSLANKKENKNTSSKSDATYATSDSLITDAFKRVDVWHTNGTPCPDGNELEFKILKDTTDGSYYFTLAGMDLSGHYKNTKTTDKYLEGKKIDYTNLAVVVSDKKGNRKVYHILSDGTSDEAIDSNYVVETKSGLRFNKKNVEQAVAGYVEKIDTKLYGNSLASISDRITVITGCTDKGKKTDGGKEEPAPSPKPEEEKSDKPADKNGGNITIYNINIYGDKSNNPNKIPGDEGDKGPFFEFDNPLAKPEFEAGAGARNYHFDFNNSITKDSDGNLLHTETSGTGPYGEITWNHQLSPFNLSLKASGYQHNGMPIKNSSNGKRMGSMTSSHYDLSPEIEVGGHFKGGEKLKLSLKGNIGKTEWNQDYEGMPVHQTFGETGYSGKVTLEDGTFDYDVEAGQDFTNLEQVVNESSTTPFKNNTKGNTTHVGGSLAFKPNDKIKIGPKVRYEKINNLSFLTGTQSMDANVTQYGGTVSFNPGDYELSGEFMTSGSKGNVSKTNVGIGAKYKRFGLKVGYEDVKAQLPTEILRRSLIKAGLQVGF